MPSPGERRDRVLAELTLLGQGKHPYQQSIEGEFLLCQDWQRASEIVERALQSSRHGRRGEVVSPPPSVITPLA